MHPRSVRIAVTALLAVSLIASLAGCSKSKNRSGPLRVAAAASLTDAFTAVGEAYTARTGVEVDFVFKSSGKLAVQLIEGAPFDIFASANEKYIAQVIDEKAAAAETKAIYAVGRVVAWVPGGSNTAPPASLDDLKNERFQRIALANPEHAPYGTAAKAALTAAGVWPAIEKRIVYGANVKQAMQYAESDNADVALIALPLAKNAGGKFFLVDGSLHAQLGQGIIISANTERRNDAQAFVDFLGSAEGHEILERYGLMPPQ